MALTKVGKRMVNPGAPPVPVATSGEGEWKVISAGVNTALAVPATGATYAWFGMLKHDTTNIVSNITGGVAAAGTQIFAATPNYAAFALCWRVD